MRVCKSVLIAVFRATNKLLFSPETEKEFFYTA